MAKKLRVLMQNTEQKPQENFELNVDYYEFKDGEYWPVESLRKKYLCSSFHIYDRAKKNNIPKRKIADVTLFKDEPEIFKKKLSGKRDQNGHRSAEHLKNYRTVQFAELCNEIRAMESKFDRMQSTLDAILNHITFPKGE